MPNTKILHVYKVDEQTDGKIFGTKSNNNFTMFISSSIILIESEVYNNAGDNDA